MVDAGEKMQPNGCFLVKLEIDNCPMAEISFSEMLNMSTFMLLDNYHDILRETVIQLLEDTTWVNDTTMSTLLNAGFGMYHVREHGVIISLRKSALQRLVSQSMTNSDDGNVIVPITIRFLLSEIDLPRAPKLSNPATEVASQSETHPPLPSSDRSNSPGSEVLDQVSELPGVSPIFPTNVAPDFDIPGTTFRGMPVDTRPAGTGPPTAGGGHSNMRREYVSPRDHHSDGGSAGGNGGGGNVPTQPRRGLLFDHSMGRTPLVRTPTRLHPYSAEVTFGAESFEDYMSQFMSSEIRFKDFRKAEIPKFDSSKNESFVHWYKLFCSTCLQWGIWCTPYESALEDHPHGAWWKMLPMSVRNNESFMAHLIYSVLIRETTFPLNSREHDAVEGCPPNAGYSAIYALLRMHHPLLHAVLSTANEIPRHRRTEGFSRYLRRLQEFIARERLATRTYTESEALDLAVRNLTAEWRNEFRRLVERDKRTGPAGTLPFKLALPQLATTFVEYAIEIGREPPGSTQSPSEDRRRSTHSTSILRRLEETHEEGADESPFMPEDDVDLIVRAIARNQESSSVCIGCQLPGHTLVDCNRFVDYIVAESLAQRHPTLRTQIANSHSHFRSRLNAAASRARTQGPRAIRSLQLTSPPPDDHHSSIDNVDPITTTIADEQDPVEHDDYRQHAIHIVDDSSDVDFESCFADANICSIDILGVDLCHSFPTETVPIVCPDAPPTTFVLHRLAATYDDDTSSVFAHADNGSMANTVNDEKLLFGYRSINASNVRLLDAGNHAHHPLGVGFLCVPTTDRGIAGAPTSVFIRTYYTPTIPGIIISHSAMSKQLRTSGYNVSSHSNKAGFIHFPHRLRRCQDIYITLQPTSQRGGLTFTEALVLPTDAEHTAPLRPPARILRLCSDHQHGPPTSIVDSDDGIFCQACQLPPLLDFR